MKHSPVAVFACLLAVVSSSAHAQIYRCGNEYTNTVSEANRGQCKLVEGGNVTVVQGFRPPAGSVAAAQPVRIATASQAGTRVDSAEQRGRDSDARLILDSELKKAESRQAELVREFNAGEPEKRGDEARNHQKYLDRVAELKAGLARNESDIAGIRRELSRVPATK
ncbi:MAG: hypothetical protein LH632_02395 [Rhodoferax sp.]|nr:hypothetical protein [Rhodoferax sp.]